MIILVWVSALITFNYMKDMNIIQNISIKARQTHRDGEWSCELGYLVVPHANVGPDVIVDHQLLFVFRLRIHRVIWENRKDENNLCCSAVRDVMLRTEALATHWVHTACSVFTQDNHYKRIMFFEHVHGWAVNSATSLNIIRGITVLISK